MSTSKYKDHDDKLSILLSQVDNWFDEIPSVSRKPIGHIILDEDRQRLALIKRTTTNWFKPLRVLDDSGLECDEEGLSSSEDELNNSFECNSKEDKTLDSEAKYLEKLVLMDGSIACDVKQENETVSIGDDQVFYYFNVHVDDDLALLDPSIGMCCTIPQSYKRESSSNNSKFLPIAGGTSLLSMKMRQEHPPTRHLTEDDLNRPVQTLTPLDHDYLYIPRAKPFTNKSILSVRNTHQHKSVLNTEVIKRFARFSNNFRLLSLKQEVLN